ncbi:MAG: aldo/keto reductase [Alphaproteobacteria bacterium]|nr:aldo/keto reductase [Alphaproteobacteria bacterium]
MKYAPLGRTGLLVSRLSFGAMTLGAGTELAAGVRNSIDQAEADRIVGQAIDAGINLFDSADTYGMGESEIMLGKALGKRRRDVIVATKAGFQMSPNRLDNGLSCRHIIKSAEDALQRLGTDWIDIFLLHRHDPRTPYEETARALELLVTQGKVRYVGACNHQAWQMERFLRVEERLGFRPMTVAQLYYSLLGRDIEQDYMEFLADTGLGTMIWSPLAGGFLTGKYRRDRPVPDGARRKQFQMPPVDVELGYSMVDQLDIIASTHGASIAQVALAWMLAKPWVSTILVGASRASQLEDNLGAIDLALSADEIAALDAITRQKARYPNPRWLADHLDDATRRAAVGKDKA